MYGDPSPANVLCTENGEVSLIDADNLRYASSPLSEQVMTPWFAAPEVYAGRSGVNVPQLPGGSSAAASTPAP
ncbi:hypothetical protein CTI14_32345 [Methylobacterium radiotolerans]|nr:hypothetical protein CTI14_32345 [Methylobacterium radiotolerans]